MGFLSGLFGSKKREPEPFADLFATAAWTRAGANYQFCCVALKSFFFSTHFTLDMLKDNNQFKSIINVILVSMPKVCSVQAPSTYSSLKITPFSSNDQTSWGQIISLPDAAHECECNFVACLAIHGEKRYFTSEFYESDQTFSLCEFKSDNSRMSYTYNTNTLESFISAIRNFTGLGKASTTPPPTNDPKAALDAWFQKEAERRSKLTPEQLEEEKREAERRCHEAERNGAVTLAEAQRELLIKLNDICAYTSITPEKIRDIPKTILLPVFSNFIRKLQNSWFYAEADEVQNAANNLISKIFTLEQWCLEKRLSPEQAACTLKQCVEEWIKEDFEYYTHAPLKRRSENKNPQDSDMTPTSAQESKPMPEKTIRFCRKCGERCEPDSVFCENCGTKLR